MKMPRNAENDNKQHNGICYILCSTLKTISMLITFWLLLLFSIFVVVLIWIIVHAFNIL